MAQTLLAAALGAGTLAYPTGAQTLEFPAHAVSTAKRVSDYDSHPVAVAPFQNGKVQNILAEGVLHQQSWRVGTGGLTTLQILAPLRRQLEDEGFSVLFECESDACGGFDFRFETDVLPEPEMHVDLGDYRYLAARRDTTDLPEYVSLVVSRSASTGFAQITRVGPRSDAVDLAGSTKAPDVVLPLAPRESGPFIDQLKAAGRATLDDLTFKTGSSELGTGTFPSLAALAAYLVGAPEIRVVLVGHTDNMGALDRNIVLSRRRAQAVADRLVAEYGVKRSQIEAEGVGFLAPRDSNQTDDGRTRNRRVEAVLATTDE